MSKRKTMTQRRAEFFATIDAFCVATDKAGYLQGCRAAAPEKHDTEDVRARERYAQNRAHELHLQLISQFNAAVRAAAQGTRRG